MIDPLNAPTYERIRGLGNPSAPSDDRSRVAAALTQVVASAEPAVVFTSLARQSVPAFSDACTIDIVESRHGAYRIGYPLTDSRRPVAAGSADAASGPITMAHAHRLRTPVCSIGDSADAFTGEVVHGWVNDEPTAADAAIAQLAVELAVAAVARERLAEAAHRALEASGHLHTALMSSRRIGTALGILMATNKITDAAAFDLLRTESQRANRKLRDLADDVVRTGWLDRQ